MRRNGKISVKSNRYLEPKKYGFHADPNNLHLPCLNYKEALLCLGPTPVSNFNTRFFKGIRFYGTSWLFFGRNLFIFGTQQLYKTLGPLPRMF